MTARSARIVCVVVAALLLSAIGLGWARAREAREEAYASLLRGTEIPVPPHTPRAVRVLDDLYYEPAPLAVPQHTTRRTR
jgi:hypothetical protein